MATSTRVFAPSGSLLALHEHRIEEVINKNIEIFLPGLDPIWRDIISTSQGVGPADALGRDLKIIKVFMGSMAGVLEQGKPRNDLSLYGDDTDQHGSRLYTQNLNQTWPSPLDGPNAMPFRLGIGMRSMMSNIMFTLGEMQAEATPAMIGEIIAPKLEGFARNISHTLCNYWYLNQADNYRLSTITSKTASGSVTGGYEVTFTPGNGAVDRYYIGQRLDVYDSSGTDRMNDSVAAGGAQALSTRLSVYVSSVDELKGTVTIFSVTDPDTNDASNWNGGAIANAQIVVYANSDHGLGGSNAFSGFAGVNSWLKSGATTNANTRYLLGDDRDTENVIDCSTTPEFKSFTKGSVGVLTEHKLRQYLRRFHAAKNKYGQYIDCLIASDGVWLNYESTKIGREILDRTGKLSSVTNEGSNEGFKFTFDGRSYTGYTSTYVEDNTVYGVRKGGNNWKKYIPPSVTGTSKFAKAGNAPFEFIAGALTGTGSNKLPIYDSSGSQTLVTEGVQMPGQMRMQLVPDQPAGLKLTGVTQDKLYSDN
tara:strand:+ start:2500 stop:4104 length:1605 start_codon:yes stop_codon:yes gene_type:complete